MQQPNCNKQSTQQASKKTAQQASKHASRCNLPCHPPSTCMAPPHACFQHVNTTAAHSSGEGNTCSLWHMALLLHHTCWTDQPKASRYSSRRGTSAPPVVSTGAASNTWRHQVLAPTNTHASCMPDPAPELPQLALSPTPQRRLHTSGAPTCTRPNSWQRFHAV